MPHFCTGIHDQRTENVCLNNGSSLGLSELVNINPRQREGYVHDYMEFGYVSGFSRLVDN